MPELLETREFNDDVLLLESWARELIRRHTGFEYELVFPVREGRRLQLDPADNDSWIQPGDHVAALLDRGVEGNLVSFVKAGAWVYGHNIAGYVPEADVYAVAEWEDAADGYRTMVEQYCSDADEENFEFAQNQAERLFDQDDGQDDRVPVFPDTPSMYPQAKELLERTPMVAGKGYLLTIPDHQRRWIELWLKWEKTAVPDELVEG